MSIKLAKKLLAVTIAASMMVVPVVAGAASSQGSTSGNSSTTATTAATETTSTAGRTVVSTTVAEANTVAGVTSTVAGSYRVKTLNGFAVKTSEADLKAAAGLVAGEKPYVKAYDISAKNSPAAFASINAAAQALGGKVIGAINVDFGKLSNGKFAELDSSVKARTAVGIPGAKADKKYVVIKVLPGGATEVLEVQDTVTSTLTFEITGGLAAYAVVEI